MGLQHRIKKEIVIKKYSYVLTQNWLLEEAVPYDSSANVSSDELTVHISYDSLVLDTCVASETRSVTQLLSYNQLRKGKYVTTVC